MSCCMDKFHTSWFSSIFIERRKTSMKRQELNWSDDKKLVLEICKKDKMYFTCPCQQKVWCKNWLR